MNEVYVAIFGVWLTKKIFIGKGHFPAEGCPSSVEFDFNKVMERQQKRGDFIGFYHTHPNMSNWYSSTDYATMETWVDCFGKELLCLIEGNNGIATYKCGNYKMASKKMKFKFLNPHIRIKRIGNWFIGY